MVIVIAASDEISSITTNLWHTWLSLSIPGKKNRKKVNNNNKICASGILWIEKRTN